MSTEQPQVPFTPNHDWDFKVNLSDVTAPTQMAGAELIEGFYKAEVSDMYINTEKNANRVVIKLKILDAPFTGMIRTDGMNRPTPGGNDNVRYYWRALAESAGYSPAQLDKGEVNLGPKSFIGKTVHVHYKPKQGEGTYDRVAYFAESVWTQHKANFVPGASAPSGESGSALGASGGGGKTTTPADVLKSFGVTLGS
jgi:hypothetical protein